MSPHGMHFVVTFWKFRGKSLVALDIRGRGGILCALSKLRDFGSGPACGGDCTFARYWGASGWRGGDTTPMTHPPSSKLASLQQTRRLRRQTAGFYLPLHVGDF